MRVNADPVRLLGEPILRTAAEPVSKFDARLARLVTRMTKAMAAAEGVGLAANQIGVGLRGFVYDLRDGRSGHVTAARGRPP
jgi:peptide deformylase